MNQTQFSILCFLLFLNWQCTTPNTTCKYGTPEAIFPSKLPKVVKHHFEIKGQNAYENVIFENGLKMEVIQSGCNEIKQFFQFILPGDFKNEPPAFWKEIAIQNFGYLSTVSDKHMSLHHLSTAIRKNYHDIKLSAPTQLEEGYFIKIDKIIGEEETILVVELASRE